MSRQIKFRAWDNRVKKLLTVLEIDWEPRGYDEHGNLKKVVSYVRALDTVTKVDVYHYDTPDEIEEILTIEQFTCLKDINGQEAYEGDIVSLDPDDPPHQIIFAEGKFEIVGNGINYDLGEEFMDCEIIGNIHENPKLLEAEK